MLKKLLAMLLVSTILLTGCQAAPSSSSQPSSSDNQMSSAIDAADPVGPAGNEQEPPRLEEMSRLMVADAAQFRGELTAIADGVYTITALPGREFGAPSIQFTMGESTRINTENPLEIGSYVEVYYGRTGTEMPEKVQAIAVNHLRSKGSWQLYNGIVKEITDVDGDLRLLIAQEETDTETLFRVWDTTQLYLNLDEIQVGDTVSVLFNGVLTRSLPGQGNALELAPYDLIVE